MINKNDLAKCLVDVNQTLFDHCEHVVDNGELAALAGWVNTPCLKTLNAVLKKWVVKGNTIEFKLAWIDKSPIATYVPEGETEEKSGELADLAIIRLYMRQGELKQNGHLFLFQAKATEFDPPFVPSTSRVGQTEKEWKFMTSWPPFTLRDWGASDRTDLTYDVMHDVTQNERASRLCQMNWFGVAPFDPHKKRKWASAPYDQSPWWTTPPVDNAECDIPLGNLLLRIATGRATLDLGDVTCSAGREFKISPPGKPVPQNGIVRPQTWTDLAHEIIRLAMANKPAKQQHADDQSRFISFLTSEHGPYADLAPADFASYVAREGRWPVIFVVHHE